MLPQIHEVSIAHSWYSIHSTNNNLYFRHQVIPPGIVAGITYRKITIPEGNYTANDLAQTLEIALNLVCDTGDRPNTYSITYNTATNKYTFSSKYSTVIFVVLNPLTVAGNSSIIKKIPVNVPYLGVINDSEICVVDYIDVSGKMLRRLSFRLSDHLNQNITLNGVDISFTLTFFRG